MCFHFTLLRAMENDLRASSVGHQYRNGDLPQDVPRRSPEHELAQPRVPVGAITTRSAPTSNARESRASAIRASALMASASTRTRWREMKRDSRCRRSRHAPRTGRPPGFTETTRRAPDRQLVIAGPMLF
jgi:hypothetical protein